MPMSIFNWLLIKRGYYFPSLNQKEKIVPKKGKAILEIKNIRGNYF